MMQGVSTASKLLDAFVCMHAIVALSFASVMLFLPTAFSLFVKAATVDPLTTDSIRWSSPFVFGFGILAALSLQMPGQSRILIAMMYAASFTIAVGTGIWVQTTGRWNSMHPINIALFGSLAVASGRVVGVCGAGWRAYGGRSGSAIT